MRFKRLQLLNFGLHRDLVVEYASGLNSITGPNGSGKSTLLKAMLFATIGENGGRRKLEKEISQFADGGKSGVLATIEHGDTVLEVERYLAGGTTQVRVNGGKPITGKPQLQMQFSSSLVYQSCI